MRAPLGRITLGGSSPTTNDAASCEARLRRLANLDDRRRLQDLAARANRFNISFYPVDPGGLAAFDTPINQDVRGGSDSAGGREFARLRDRTDAVRMLAANTDGLAVVNTNDLAGGLKRILDDVSAYYLLGYYSTNKKMDGKFRSIQVRVKRPGVNVRARRGYLAPTEEEMRAREQTAAAPTQAPSPVETAIAALSRLREDADIRARGTVLGGELAVVAELANGPIERGRWAAGADVHVRVSTQGGTTVGEQDGHIAPATRSTLVRVPLADATTGPWRVSVVARGDGEPVSDQIDVRPTTGHVLGEPMLFRATPAPRSPLLPVADAQYRRTERAHIEWPLLQPIDTRSAVLLDRLGQPMPLDVTLTERDDLGQSMLAVDVSLAPLAPGDYVISLAAGSGNDVERHLLALRVIR